MNSKEINKKFTAFIFARGGSKGVRNKNIRDVNGTPMIGYSIKSALSSKYISRVVVSTDSDKIAEVAQELGADVLKRPQELAQDATPEILAWKHAINAYKNDLYSLFISLPATSPMREVSDIDGALEKFFNEKNDILFGITQSSSNPYLSMMKVNEMDRIEVVIPGHKGIRRQEVPKTFNVSSIYISNTEYLLNTEHLMSGNVGYFKIPQERSLDIDTEYDLHLACLLKQKPFKLGK